MSAELAPSPEFDRLVLGHASADLERVALEIARDHDGEADIENGIARLEALASRLGPRVRRTDDALTRVAQINWLLYVEEKFVPNDHEYEDPRNSFLHEVLARRTGLPIMMSLVYRAIARRVGLRLEGVRLPGHFVLRTVPPEPETFIDAYHGGRTLDRRGCLELARRYVPGLLAPPDLFDPMEAKLVVIRMLSNLRSHFALRGDLPSLELVLRRLAMLEPASPDIAFQLSRVLLHLDRAGEAYDCLTVFLRMHGPAPTVVESLLSELQAELARRN